MTLMLHCGAEAVDLPMLREMETPEATATHVPIAHADLVEMVKYSLGFFGHDVIEEHHAITKEGSRYFGLLSLKSAYGDYTDTIGLRNSHDKSFPAAVAYGSRVFVCDNLAFHGEHVVKRRHTKKLKRELPALIGEIVQPLHQMRAEQNRVITRYHATPVTDELADHAVMEMFRQGVLNVQRIPHVAGQWREPEHDYGEKTAWRLFNAATHALAGRVAENPIVTRKLHDVIDGVCERVN